MVGLKRRCHGNCWGIEKWYSVGLVLLVGAIGDSRLWSQHPPITDLAFAPDGTTLVACSQRGVQFISWPELKTSSTIPTKAASLYAVTFSPDGKQLAVGGGSPADVGNVEIFSWPDCRSQMSLANHSDTVTQVAWTDSSHLLSSSLDRTVQLWDLGLQRATCVFSGHSKGVSSVAFWDQESFATSSIDHTVRVWNLKTGELTRSLSQHSAPVHSVASRPPGEGLPMIATSSHDRTVRFWQPTIGRMVRYVRLESEALDIAWINRDLLIASCADGQARVIDANNVTVLESIAAIDGWAYAVAVHPTDGSIAIAGSDGQIRRIELKSRK